MQQHGMVGPGPAVFVGDAFKIIAQQMETMANPSVQK
jgi:hypothetical protein